MFYLAHAAILPRLTDVQTNPDEPLEFKTLNTMRPADANPLKDPDPAQIDAQDDAYPDIEPMVLERSAPEVFSIVHEAVDRLGWEIVVSEPPGETRRRPHRGDRAQPDHGLYRRRGDPDQGRRRAYPDRCRGRCRATA